jgi:hypothetical protein
MPKIEIVPRSRVELPSPCLSQIQAAVDYQASDLIACSIAGTSLRLFAAYINDLPENQHAASQGVRIRLWIVSVANYFIGLKNG